jgi:hypothetical protein
MRLFSFLRAETPEELAKIVIGFLALMHGENCAESFGI